MTNPQSTQYASPGAVNQTGGRLPIKHCKRCHAAIVWCTSKRTGKGYPVNVSTGYHDQRFYIGSNVHRCEPVLALQAALDANDAAMTEAKAKVDTLMVMQDKLAAGEITRDDMIAWVDAGMPAVAR